MGCVNLTPQQAHIIKGTLIKNWKNKSLKKCKAISALIPTHCKVISIQYSLVQIYDIPTNYWEVIGNL